MQKNPNPCYYPDYLKLNMVLGSQEPLSGKYGEEAHDETLFIIVHQVYELWFKQILHEMGVVLNVFGQDYISESDLGSCLSKTYRVKSIQKVLIDQLNIIETMTPQAFLDFRDYLVPASGFQSVQFRELEIRLGLKTDNRVAYDNKSFHNRLSAEHQEYLINVEKQPALIDLLANWLERLPFVDFGGFKFWEQYQTAVWKMLDSDSEIIKNNPTLNHEEIKLQLKELDLTRASFESLFDDEKYNERFPNHVLSRKAMLSALFIKLYSWYPLLDIPARFLTSLMDIDELLANWRHNHALMVQRMIGTKIGTGGSAGHTYLKATTHSNRVFTDLFNISTFLVPTSALPKLPEEVIKNLQFQRM